MYGLTVKLEMKNREEKVMHQFIWGLVQDFTYLLINWKYPAYVLFS